MLGSRLRLTIDDRRCANPEQYERQVSGAQSAMSTGSSRLHARCRFADVAAELTLTKWIDMKDRARGLQPELSLPCTTTLHCITHS
jgi:hypothetical protein